MLRRCQMPEVTMLWLMTGTPTGEMLKPTQLIIALLQALCTLPRLCIAGC